MKQGPTLSTLVAAAALTACLCHPPAARAENEVGFIERFALAADREQALGELVPGSEDYYFFHCLHYQSSRNEGKFKEFMDQWRQRFPDENPRRRIIENRQALLDYDASPQQTLDYLKRQLGVTHQHQQEVRDRKPNLPVTLDPKRVERGVFERDALRNDSSLGGLTPSALESLVRTRTALSPQQRRALLSRLERPDVPNLPELIIADLKSPESRGFGEFNIHRALLPAQLEALAKAVPALATHAAFVQTRMRKLAPSPDVDVAFDAAEREAWLDRLWSYAKTLPPAFNSLKAQILYQRLDHDRMKGVYDPARFLEYVKLPRGFAYVNPKWLERRAQTNDPQCDLNADFSAALVAHRPIGNDEPLVREYFLAIFDQAAKANPGDLGEKMMAPYTDYVLDTWLRPILAEALITGGHGNAERWASLLSPAGFQQLKERVDIEFPATNPPFFQPGETAAFDVIVKNTPQLIVRIYELNALNFFLTQKRQLNTDLNLDGLVANSEQTHRFDGGPFKRNRQTFKFPELKGRRGAWIIEFIGTGRSSRALVRVGQWQVIQQTGPAGDLLQVLDENRQPVTDAVAWLDGRKLTPDAKLGRIVVPFTRQPGMRPLVLSDPAGTFATLTQFDHHAEDYRLDARFHIEREQLLGRRDATLAVRAVLMLGDARLDPALVIDPQQSITTTTLDGIATTREVKNLKLGAGGELTHTLQVPERLAQLAVTLSGKVEVLSAGGEKRDINASHTWSLNGMDKSDATHDGHLAKFAGDHVYDLLGKNGEPVADQQVVFQFRHRGFARPEMVALKSDDKGRIALGPLAGIASVTAKAPNGRESTWQLEDADRTWSSVVHAAAGTVVRVPWMAGGLPHEAVAAGAALSFLEIKAGTFTEDHAGKLSIRDGYVEIAGLAPGDYSLRMRDDERDIAIQVTAGREIGGWLIGNHRNLEIKNTAPLQITGVTTEPDTITVKLANAGDFTRVHIAASRFDPGKGIFAGLGGFERFGVASGTPAKQPNLFAAGRQIGDEYRYILERRYGKIYPGNMLTRPGLLLNPWEVRDTGLDELALKEMQQAGATAGGRGEGRGRATKEEPATPLGAVPGGAAADSDLDFLAASEPVLYNLLPDRDGVVRIDRKALGDRQHVQVYAEDLANAVWRSFALPEVPTRFSDLRLARNLDPAKPFTQRKQISVLEKGRTLTLEDVLTSELETYDTLGGVHALFTTLSGDATLAKFAWILQWPQLKEDEKLARYSEFACHELNFFLARKDPAFFAKVVKPSLSNKKDKTFMDDFLLERELSCYLQPTAYARLNVVERALLGQRVKGEAANAARSLRELWELVPPNPELQDRLFETALRGRAMESGPGQQWGDELKLEQDKKRAEATNELRAFSKAENKPVAAAAPSVPPREATKAQGLTSAVAHRQIAGKMKAKIALNDEESEVLAEMDADVADQFSLGDAAKDALSRSNKLRLSNGTLAIDGANSYFGRDAAAADRARVRAYYRELGPTKEWAENNYYHLRINQQDGNLIPISGFWRDYAQWTADGARGAFVSPHVAEASHHFTEMLLALAVLDLPFDAPKHDGKTADGRFVLTAGGPVIAYHKEIQPGEAPAANAQQGQLLVSQSFFRAGDRYRLEGNEKFEKYVTAEFLTGTVYGANVVVTNPTSAPAKAEVLMQIPRGALPVLGSKATDARSVRLEPYTTKTFEYHFYFPITAGANKFPHFPVHVAINGGVAGAAKAFEFNVVSKLTQVDKASWDYISQYGTEAEVFAFLEQNNLAALALPRVAWRCHDAGFFKRLTGFLAAHHVWDETIYSYALLHNEPVALREWILHRNDFVAACGPYLSSTLVVIDPVERRAYEHLEYSPLVNQRAHRLGSEARIANPAILAQYRALLDLLAHKPALDAADHMSVTYYLFLQDRVDEALTRLHQVDVKDLPTRLQHDYFLCYAGFYENNLAAARGIAARYGDYPVERWRRLFAEVTGQLDEIEGKAATPGKNDPPDREKQHSELAASEPSFDFKVENQTIALNYRNLTEVAVRYYLMDPEFSFSSNPFVGEDASRFSIIQPNKSVVRALPKDQDTLELPLPAEFAKANVLVEIVGAGQRKAQAYHANTLKLVLTENYGRLETRDSANNRAVAKAYVKVYARLKNGTVRFFKDGYTDLRGRFDYASLNSGSPGQAAPVVQQERSRPAAGNGLDYQMLKPAELTEIEKFSILILSDSHGAATREVAPPSE